MANQNYLTELILSIHNEVQSAVDFISSVSKEGSELGESDALMQIENLRVKLPFNVELESKTQKIPIREPISTVNVATPAVLRSLLASRKGFLVDIGTTGKMGSFTKVKVAVQPPLASDSPETLRGEIEIVFSPLQRK